MNTITPRLSPAPPSRRGLSVVEVLISLSISAMLLTAVAAAFSASGAAVENNDEFFRATQAARVSMNQILTEARRAHAVSVSTDGCRINMITFDNHDRSYIYNSANKTLMLVTNDNTTDRDYTLAAAVNSCAFTADTQTDQQGISHTIRICAALEVQVGHNTIRLSGSAAPRREQTY